MESDRFFDDNKAIGTKNEYGPVLGGMEVLNAWDKPLAVAVAMGDPIVLKKWWKNPESLCGISEYYFSGYQIYG